MGTRGLFGFHFKGRTKVTYNHFDSYPGGLGLDLLKELRELDPEAVRKAASGTRLVSGQGKPTEKVQARYQPVSNTGVNKQTTEDWYCLLRECQGTIKPWVTGGKLPEPARHMIDGKSFGGDPVFCEYGYVINLDSGMFEVYEGFGKGDPVGLFAEVPLDSYSQDNSYKQITKTAEFPLDNLPSDKDFLAVADPPDEDED